MKKILSILLVLVMTVTLCACGSSDNEGGVNAPETTGGSSAGSSGLMVGYARVDITPGYSVPLAGYGNTSMRMSTGFQSYLYTTCVAYSDGEDTILVFQNDLSGANAAIVSNTRKEIEKKYGVPQGNIMIAGTHTHSAPDVGNSAEPSIAKYREELVDWMVEAAGEALEDLKPATLTYGVCYPENLNFIRHYTTESGIVKGDNFGDLVDSPYTGHTHDADNQMQVVRITREGGDDVVLINWQSHPHRGGGSKNYNITSDIVGVMRDYVESEVDGVLFAYYTGASGNVNPSSRISSENITSDYWEQGKALGGYAVDVLNGGEMIGLASGNVQVVPYTFTGEVNHTEDHLVTVARIVQEEWTTNNNFTDAVKLANSYGINSPYHAGGIISKANLGKTYDVEMYAISVGDLAFVTAPYEMYDENGKTIKDGSPFTATFVITCCNNGIGYIPSVEGYDNNTYEANTGKFVRGTGETLAQEYIKLLEQLYTTK